MILFCSELFGNKTTLKDTFDDVSSDDIMFIKRISSLRSYNYIVYFYSITYFIKLDNQLFVVCLNLIHLHQSLGIFSFQILYIVFRQFHMTYFMEIMVRVFNPM